MCVLIFAGAVTFAGAPAVLADGGHFPAPAGAGPRVAVITTVAGGPGGPAPGRSVALDHPCGVASSGKALYFSESLHDVVRRLDQRSGVLSTAAGTGTTALNGSFQPPPQGQFFFPCSVAVDGAGNLVIFDTGNGAVVVKAARTGVFYGARMRAGHTYVVASVPTFVPFPLFVPTDALGLDRHGNLLITELTNNDPNFNQGSAAIYVLAGARGTFYGQAMVPGHVYPLAGCISQDCPPGFGGDGGPALSATFGQTLPGVAADRSGNVLIADPDNNRIRVVAGATGKFYGLTMTAGDIYTIAGGGGDLGDGRPAAHTLLSSPQGVALDRAGNVLIADTGHNQIRVVAAGTGRFYGRRMIAGDIYTLAGNGRPGFSGDGGLALRAELSGPAGMAVDSAGNLAIVEQGWHNRVRLVAVRTGLFYGRQMKAGRIYVVAGNGQTAYSGDGGLATRAELSPFAPSIILDGSSAFEPGGLAAGPDGSVVVADSANNRVRVVAGRTGVFYGRKMIARHIYTVAGTGIGAIFIDSGPATSVRLNNPGGLAVDRAGNIVVSDSFNQRILVIAARTDRFYGRRMTAGDIYTLAKLGAESFPQGLAVDGSGNVIAADIKGEILVVAGKTGRFYGQQMIAGRIYTLQTTPVGQADTASVTVAVDHHGNIVAGNDYDQVLVIAVKAGRFYGVTMIPNHAYVVAGGRYGFSGDRGPAVKAALRTPAGVAVDAAGNLLLADMLNNRIRVVAERSGVFYGVKMTAGDIYTVAGSRTRSPAGISDGFSGDGGPATKAVLNFPCGVVPYGKGLLILDAGNSRVRQVSG